jgi:transcriptional regulator with XRE-family HTH domain
MFLKTGEDFKKLRKALGFTQVEAAREAGVALGTWNCWEYGRCLPGRLTTPMVLKLLRRAEKVGFSLGKR